MSPHLLDVCMTDMSVLVTGEPEVEFKAIKIIGKINQRESTQKLSEKGIINLDNLFSNFYS